MDAEADFRYSFIEGNFIITNTSELTDYGKYQCKAENSFGAVLSRDALLQFACEYFYRAFFFALLNHTGSLTSDKKRTYIQ